MGEKVKFKIETWEVKIKILSGVALILMLTAITLSTGFAQQIPTPAPTGQITDADADADAGIKGVDLGLVTDVGKASQDFMGEITQKINISEEGFGDERAIDDLIILMNITLEFTSKVINIIQDKDMKTGLETNLIADERVEEAFQYLRFLQSEDPCREAINMMEENRTIT